MQRRLSNSKISKAEFEAFQRKIHAQMKQNVDIQGELLKSISNFRQASESIAKASEKLSHVVGKLAVSTVSTYQINKEYNAVLGTPVSLESEMKQRNLTLALQQVVKFHTLLNQQQQNVIMSLTNDFEKPIQSNLDKYREVVNNWDKDLDKDVRKLANEIKSKRAEAAKTGKKNTPDMEKLQMSLQEISMLVGELEKTKVDQIDTALTTDHYQYILVAHHLQKVLKSEVTAFRNVYYQDGVTKSQNSTRSSVSPIMTTPPKQISGPNLATNPQSQQFVPEAISQLDYESPTVPEKTYLNIYPNTPRYDASPVPPPRRASDDESTPHMKPLTSPDMSHMYTMKPPPQLNQAHDEFYLPTSPHPATSEVKHNHHHLTPDRPNRRKNHQSVIPSPRVSSVHEQVQLRKQPSLPSLPKTHHRKTLLAPVGANIQELESLIDANFGHGRKSTVHSRKSLSAPVKLRQSSRDKRASVAPRGYESRVWKNTVVEDNYSNTNSVIMRDSIASSNTTDGVDLVLVVYDYIGSEPDDLNVLEGDVVRVVATEDEWIYGILMTPAFPGSSEYVPAEAEGVPQVGWLPKAFVESFEE